MVPDDSQDVKEVYPPIDHHRVVVHSIVKGAQRPVLTHFLVGSVIVGGIAQDAAQIALTVDAHFVVSALVGHGIARWNVFKSVLRGLLARIWSAGIVVPTAHFVAGDVIRPMQCPNVKSARDGKTLSPALLNRLRKTKKYTRPRDFSMGGIKSSGTDGSL